MPRPPSPSTLRLVRRRILAWYAVAHRDFPWRQVDDPYAILVSEVMLQQTQAARVVERFPRFLARFPTAPALADAPEAGVLAEWSGLGYNRRALSLRRAAAAVARSGWPTDVAALEALPGIGRYTARAVASLAFGVPVGVVDTNVRRWLIRRFGIAADGPDGSPGALQRLADRLARPGGRPPPAHEVAAWTHATMEFGAAVCRSRSPLCGVCPIAAGCPSRGRATLVPVTRQAPFVGSRRAVRGSILRQLVADPSHAVAVRLLADGAPARSGAALQDVIASLVDDGLAHLVGSRVHLGPAEEPERPGTIRP